MDNFHSSEFTSDFINRFIVNKLYGVYDGSQIDHYIKRLDDVYACKIEKELINLEGLINKTKIFSKDKTGLPFVSAPIGVVLDPIEFNSSSLLSFAVNTCQSSVSMLGGNNFSNSSNLPASLQLAIECRYMLKTFEEDAKNLKDEDKNYLKCSFIPMLEDLIRLLDDHGFRNILDWKGGGDGGVNLLDAVNVSTRNKKLAINFAGKDDGDTAGIDKDSNNNLVELFLKGTGIELKDSNGCTCKNGSGLLTWLATDDLEMLLKGMKKIYEKNGLKQEDVDILWGLYNNVSYNQVYIIQAVMHSVALYYLNEPVHKRKAIANRFSKLLGDIISQKLDLKLTEDSSKTIALGDMEKLVEERFLQVIVGKNEFSNLEKQGKINQILSFSQRIRNQISNAQHANQLIELFIRKDGRKKKDGFIREGNCFCLPMYSLLNWALDSKEYKSDELKGKLRKSIKELQDIEFGFWNSSCEEVNFSAMTEQKLGSGTVGDTKETPIEYLKNSDIPKKYNVNSYRRSKYFEVVTARDIIDSKLKKEEAFKKINAGDVDSINNETISTFSNYYQIPNEFLDKIPLDKLKEIKEECPDQWPLIYRPEYFNSGFSSLGDSYFDDDKFNRLVIAPETSLNRTFLSKTTFKKMSSEQQLLFFRSYHVIDNMEDAITAIKAEVLKSLQNGGKQDKNIINDLVNCYGQDLNKDQVRVLDLDKLGEDAIEVILTAKIDAFEFKELFPLLSKTKNPIAIENIFLKSVDYLSDNIKKCTETDINTLMNDLLDDGGKTKEILEGIQNNINSIASKFNSLDSSLLADISQPAKIKLLKIIGDYDKLKKTILDVGFGLALDECELSDDFVKSINLYEIEGNGKDMEIYKDFISKYGEKLSEKQLLALDNNLISEDKLNNLIAGKENKDLIKQVFKINNKRVGKQKIGFEDLNLENDSLFKHIFSDPVFYKQQICEMLKLVFGNEGNKFANALIAKFKSHMSDVLIKNIFSSSADNLGKFIDTFGKDLKTEEIQAIDLSKLKYEELKSFVENYYMELSEVQIKSSFSTIKTKEDFNKVCLFPEVSEKLEKEIKEEKSKEDANGTTEKWDILKKFKEAEKACFDVLTFTKYCRDCEKKDLFKRVDVAGEDAVLKELGGYTVKSLAESRKKGLFFAYENLDALKKDKDTDPNGIFVDGHNKGDREFHFNLFEDAFGVIKEIMKEDDYQKFKKNDETFDEMINRYARNNVKSHVLEDDMDLYNGRWKRALRNLSLKPFVDEKKIDDRYIRLFDKLTNEKLLSEDQIADLGTIADKNGYTCRFVLRNLKTLIGDLDAETAKNKIDKVNENLKISKDQKISIDELYDFSRYGFGEEADLINRKGLHYLSVLDFDQLLNLNMDGFTDKCKRGSSRFYEYRLVPLLSCSFLVYALRNKTLEIAKQKNCNTITEDAKATLNEKFDSIFERIEHIIEQNMTSNDFILKNKFTMNGSPDVEKRGRELLFLGHLHRNLNLFSKNSDIENQFNDLFSKKLTNRLEESTTAFIKLFEEDGKVKNTLINKLFNRKSSLLLPSEGSLFISKKSLNYILDNSDDSEPLFKETDQINGLVSAIDIWINDIDVDFMKKIISKVGEDCKISNVAAEKLVSGLKNFETIIPIIDKLDSVTSKKTACEFLKKLALHLDACGNIDIDKTKGYLSSFIGKIDAEDLSENTDEVNKLAVVYETLKSCLERLKSEDNKIDTDLVKLIIQKFGRMFMKEKTVAPNVFIDLIKELCNNESFDLDMYKALVDANCITSETFKCFATNTDDLITSMMAIDYYLSKSCKQYLKDFEENKTNPELLKVVFNKQEFLLDRILSDNCWVKVDDGSLSDLKRFYLYFNCIAEIGIADEKYKDLIPKMFSHLISKVLGNNDENKGQYAYFLKLGIFLDIAIGNKMTVGNETLKQIINEISKFVSDDVEKNSFVSVVATQVKKLYIETGGNVNDFKNQILNTNTNLFDLKGDVDVVVKNNTSGASLRFFKNDIDKCYVKLEGGNIKYREIAARENVDDKRKEELLPRVSDNLKYKYDTNSGKGVSQELFKYFAPNGYKLQYKIGNGDVKDWDPDNIPQMTSCGSYNITFYFKDSELYNDFEETVAVDIKKADIKTFDLLDKVANQFEYTEDGQKLLKGSVGLIPDGCKVSYKVIKNDVDTGFVEINDVNELLSIEAGSAGNYKICIKAEGENFNTSKKELNVNVSKKKISIDGLVFNDDLTFNGVEQSILASLPDLPAGCKLQYEIGEGGWNDCVDGQPKLKDAGKKKINFKIIGNENYEDSEVIGKEFEMKKGEFDNEIFPDARTGLVKDKDGAALDLFDKPKKNNISGVKIEFRVIDPKKSYENADEGWQEYNPDLEDLKKSEVGSYKYQFRATDENNNYNQKISSVIDVTIVKEDAKDLGNVKDLLLTVNKTENLVYTGDEFNLFNKPTEKLPEGCKLKYKVVYTNDKKNVNSGAWLEFSEKESLNIKDAGDYKILQWVDGGTEYKHYQQKENDAGVMEIKIEKAKINIDPVGTLNKNIEYNSENQGLFNESVNELLGAGYKLQYKIGEQEWNFVNKDKLPMIKDAGKYNVCLKVIGDKNHEDSDEIGPIEVNMTKKQLNGDDYYPTPVEDLEYSSDSQELFNNPKKTLPDGLRLMYRLGKKGQWLVWNSKNIPNATDANSYEYIFKIEEVDGKKNNYILPDEKAITAKINKKQLEAEQIIKLKEKLVYTGVTQEPFEFKTELLPKSKKLLWSKDGNTWIELNDMETRPSFVDANDNYEFWFKIDGDENYEGFSTKYDVKVDKAKINDIEKYFPQAVNNGYIQFDGKEKELFMPPSSVLGSGQKLLWKLNGETDDKYVEYSVAKDSIPKGGTNTEERVYMFKFDGGKNYESCEKVYTVRTMSEIRDIQDNLGFWPELEKIENENGYQLTSPKIAPPEGCKLQIAIVDKEEKEKEEPGIQNLKWEDYDDNKPIKIQHFGKYYIYTRIKGSFVYKDLNGKTMEAEVEKQELNFDDVVLPKERQGLEYNGDDQSLFEDKDEELINFIKSLEAKGCKLKYKIGNEEWKEYDTQNPPKAKEAKKYTVHFMVDGGENYKNKNVGPIEIEVKTKENTEPPKLKEEDIKWPSAAENLEADGTEHPLLVHDESFKLPEGYVWKYKFFCDGNWQDSIPTRKDVATYFVQVAVSDESNNLIEKKDPIEVEIKQKEIENTGKKKIDPKDVIWPKAVDSLELSDNAHKLVDASETKCPEGCKFMYSLNPNGPWTEDIPEGKDVKEYLVYCKIDGGDNYEDLIKEEVIKAQIKQKENSAQSQSHTESGSKSKITSITTNKIELKDKKNSNDKPISLDIIKINIGEKEVFVDELTNIIVNSQGQPIDENDNPIDLEKSAGSVRKFKDVYADVELEESANASTDIFERLKSESLMDEFKTRVTALINSSDKEIAEKLDKLEAKELKDEILSSSLNKEIVGAYIDNVQRFIEKHNEKYKLKNEDGSINWQKVGEAACKEFSASTGTKVSGGILTGVGGLGVIASGAVLTADAAFGVGIAALGIAAPYVLIASGPLALIGIGVFITSYLVRRSNEKELDVNIDDKGNVVKLDKNGKPVGKVVKTIKILSEFKKIFGPRQTKEDNKDNNLYKDGSKK